MKKKFVFLFVMIMAISGVKAEKFYGVSTDNDVVTYSATATVVNIEECNGYMDLTLACEYQFIGTDTIVESVFIDDVNKFTRYLSVGDKIDFDSRERYILVRRVRPDGLEHGFFIEPKAKSGLARVLRVNDEGAIMLDNGLVIKRPKYQHEVGDKIYFKESIVYAAMAKEIKKRAL